MNTKTKDCPKCSGTGKVPDNVGAKLREARERKGMSLRTMAKYLHKSPTFISYLENDEMPWSNKTVSDYKEIVKCWPDMTVHCYGFAAEAKAVAQATGKAKKRSAK